MAVGVDSFLTGAGFAAVLQANRFCTWRPKTAGSMPYASNPRTFVACLSRRRTKKKNRDRIGKTTGSLMWLRFGLFEGNFEVDRNRIGLPNVNVFVILDRPVSHGWRSQKYVVILTPVLSSNDFRRILLSQARALSALKCIFQRKPQVKFKCRREDLTPWTTMGGGGRIRKRMPKREGISPESKALMKTKRCKGPFEEAGANAVHVRYPPLKRTCTWTVITKRAFCPHTPNNRLT